MTQFIATLTGFSLWGSIVNCIMVIVGSFAGLMVKQFMKSGVEGGAMHRVSDALMKGMALCVLLIGVTGAIGTKNIIIVIISIGVGAVIGELCNLDKGIHNLGDSIEKATKGRFGNVAQGFVTASLLFCVGSMAIVGSLNSGLLGDHTMQYTKGLIDMISAFVFATTLGIGVIFSAFFVLIYQGAITLLAAWIEPFLSTAAITEMTAVGSLLIVALSLNMLGLTKIKVMNYVPAIFLPILLCLFI